MLLGIIIFIIFYNFNSEWSLKVIEKLKEPATFVTLLTTFFGILGAYLVANNQIKKTLKFSNPQYLQNFNMAQIHIDEFKRKVEEVERVVCTMNRIRAKYIISWDDLIAIQECIIKTINLLNPDIDKEEILKNFSNVISKINKDAPPYFYYSMNGLIFKMVYLYDALLTECEYLELYGNKPNQIMRYFIGGAKMSPTVLKDFTRTYKKQVKGLTFKNY